MASTQSADTSFSASAQSALERAARWLLCCSQAVSADGDTEALTLIIFGISCVLRIIAPVKQPVDIFGAMEHLTEQLLQRWAFNKGGLRASFNSGAFVAPMMTAAAIPSNCSAAGALQEMCIKHWQEIADSASLTPTLLWTGRRLAAVIEKDPIAALSPAWWKSEISNLISPYTITVSSIQQVSADVAALSAYGQVTPPLPDREREYLQRTLPFLTFFYVKEQDLDMVCPLLRALRYLGMNTTAEYNDAIHFVLQRNRADGSFTMRDMATHLHSRSTRGSINTERQIHLPLTVASIWALVDSLFPSHGPFQLRTRQRAILC